MDAAPAPAPAPASLRSDARCIGLIGFAHAGSHFFQLILPPLFPWLMREFDLSFTEVGAVMTLFFVISGFGQALAGFAVDPNAMSDVQVAYYRAVQNLARLSYQAIIAATFVVFPLVSKSTFDDDQETTRRYVHVTMRYSLIFATAIAVVMAANPRNLLDIPYADDYAQLGAPALTALALGNVAFSLFAIAGTILNGAGFTRDAIIGAAVTLGLAAVGNLIAIPQCEPGRQMLLVAATTTGVAMAIGAAVCGAFLHKRLGAFLPLASLVRVVIAVAAAVAVGQVIPWHSKLMTLAEAVVVGVVFLAVLVVTRELGKADLRSIAAVRAKRGTGGEVA